MRFLCLHGGGTNGEIFEIQTGGLRQALEKSGHRFKFMNGKMDAKVEEELEGIVDGPFYNHYNRGSSPGSSIHEAFDHTKNFIAKEGPFDAVIGFSQGAALAASLLIHQSKNYPAEPSLFRAAVFICGAAPWDSTGLQHILPQPNTYPISIPTANIVGKADALFPEGIRLFELCEPAKATFYDHGSKHMVPFDMKNTEEMVRIIEETVAKAIRG
ncbi:Serine hydrolase FSH [Penicillium concentricum]|uniref:Serine hydrolase FSH n=1 Tax=Penicillium concentricum TaxID=293559 RepID=A0A9W9S7Q6_9EURO|nr:Serine hydrolase FSH [Penicillium concentricum]KAJ5372915.1 Serine hydrolase FSH [Penicillium concentricum]